MDVVLLIVEPGTIDPRNGFTTCEILTAALLNEEMLTLLMTTVPESCPFPLVWPPTSR
ncbi:MAG: hypothetical protein JRN66_08140 [Nitrososphaerota archaeon]|nr:hypothetical protein [Nitrososphaerota archaeon]